MSNVTRDRLLFAAAIILAGIYLFPLYWMYITTIKSGSEMFATPPTFWPTDPSGRSSATSGKAGIWAGISGIR